MVTTRAQMSKQISKPGRKKKPKIPKKYLAGLSSSEKAKKQLGWEAKTDVKSLASIMVSFDKKRL